MKIKFYSDVKVIIKTEDIQKKNIIYCLTFPNGKQYIGQTKQTLEERLKQHVYRSFTVKDSEFESKKSRAIRKYMTFSIEIFYEGDNLDDKEIEFVKQLDTKNKGYNLTDGGGGGGRKYKSLVTNETKQKLSTASKGNSSHNTPILQYDKLGIFIKEWKSLEIVQKELKISRTAIGNCLNNRSKTSGGFIWKYKNK